MALCRGQTPRSVPSGRSPSAFARDVFWKFLSQGVSFAFQLATTIALARLLTPRDYGLAAMVLVFRRLVMIFSDFALTPALVQRPVLTDKDRSTAFWTSHRTGHRLHHRRYRDFGGNRVSLRTTRGPAAVHRILILLSASFSGCDAGCVADARPRVSKPRNPQYHRHHRRERPGGRSCVPRLRTVGDHLPTARDVRYVDDPPLALVRMAAELRLLGRERAWLPQVQRQRFRDTDAHVSHFEPRQLSRWSCARPGLPGCVPAFLQPGHLSAEQSFEAHSFGLVSGVLADGRRA